MKSLLLTTLFIGLQLIMYGQIIKTTPSVIEYDKKNIDAYEVIINCDKDKAKSYWNEFMEKENNTDIKGFGLFQKKDLLETELVTIKSISNEPIKLFMKFSEDKGKTTLALFAKNKNNVFIKSESPEDLVAFENLKRLAHRYLNYFLPKYHQLKIETAKDNLNDTQKDLEKINKNIEDNNEDIVKNSEDVEKLKNEIEELKNETEKTKDQLKKNKKEKIGLESKKEKALEIIESEKKTFTELQQMLNTLEPK